MNNCETLSNQGVGVAESNIFNTSISSINKREVFSYTHQRTNSAIISPLTQLTPNQQDSQVYINPLPGEGMSLLNYFSPQPVRSASNNNFEHAQSQRPHPSHHFLNNQNFNFQQMPNIPYQNQLISNPVITQHSNHQSQPQCLTSSNQYNPLIDMTQNSNLSNQQMQLQYFSNPRDQQQTKAHFRSSNGSHGTSGGTYQKSKSLGHRINPRVNENQQLPLTSDFLNNEQAASSQEGDSDFQDKVKEMREQILLEKQRELNKQIEDLRYHQQLVQKELEKLNIEAKQRQECESEMRSRVESQERQRIKNVIYDDKAEPEPNELMMSKFSFSNPLQLSNQRNNFILNSQQQYNLPDDERQQQFQLPLQLQQYQKQNTLNFYPQQNLPFQPIFQEAEEFELNKESYLENHQEQVLTEENVTQQIEQTQMHDLNQYQSVQHLTTEEIQENFPQSPYWNTLEQDQDQNKIAAPQQSQAEDLRERVQNEMKFMRESRDSQTRNHISSFKPSTFQNAPMNQNDKKIGGKRLSIYLSQSTKAISGKEDNNEEVFRDDLNQSELNPNNFFPGASSIDKISHSNTLSSNQIQFLQFQASGKNLHAHLDQSYDLSKHHATSKDQSMQYQELQKKLNTNSSRLLTQEFQPPPEPISYPNLPILITEEEAQIAKIEASVTSAAHPLEITGSMKQSPRNAPESAIFQKLDNPSGARVYHLNYTINNSQPATNQPRQAHLIAQNNFKLQSEQSSDGSFSLDLTSLKKKAVMNTQLQNLLAEYERMQDYINLQKQTNQNMDSEQSDDQSMIQDFLDLKRSLIRMVEAEDKLMKELQRKGMHKNQVIPENNMVQFPQASQGMNTDSSEIYQTQRQEQQQDAMFDAQSHHFYTQQSDSSYPYLTTEMNYEQEINFPKLYSNVSSYLHTNTLYSAQDSHRDGQAQYATQALNSVQKLTTNTSLLNSSRIQTQKKKQTQSTQRNDQISKDARAMKHEHYARNLQGKNIVIDDLEEDLSVDKKAKMSGDFHAPNFKAPHSYAQIHSTKNQGSKHSKFLMKRNDSKPQVNNKASSPVRQDVASTSAYNTNYTIPSQKIAEIKANSNKKLAGQAGKPKHTTQSSVVQKLTQPTISSRNKSTERYTLQVWNERSKQNETLYQSVLNQGKSPAREKSRHSKEMSQDNFYSQGQKAKVKSPVFSKPVQQAQISQQQYTATVQSYQKLQQARKQPLGIAIKQAQINEEQIQKQEFQSFEQREQPEFRIPDEPSSIQSNKQTEGEYNISNITQKVPSSFAESNFEMIEQFREHGFPQQVPKCSSLRSLAEQQIGSKISSRPTERVNSDHQDENQIWKTTINFDSPKENSKDQLKLVNKNQDACTSYPQNEEHKASAATLQFFSDQNKELTLGKQIPESQEGGSLEDVYPEVRQFVIDSQDLRFEGSTNSNQISPRDPIVIQDMYKNFMHKEGNVNSQISTLARITPIISPQTNFKLNQVEEVKNIASLSELSCHPEQSSERMTPILQKYQEKTVLKSPKGSIAQQQAQVQSNKNEENKLFKYTLDMLQQNQRTQPTHQISNLTQQKLETTVESSRNVTNQRNGNGIGHYGHSNQSSIHQINIGLQHSLMNNQHTMQSNITNASTELQQQEEVKIQLTRDDHVQNTQKSSPRLGGQRKNSDVQVIDRQSELVQSMARNKAQQNRIAEIRNQIQAQKESQRQTARVSSITKTVQRYSARPIDRSASSKRNSDLVNNAQIISFASKNQHRRQMSNIETLLMNKRLIEEEGKDPYLIKQIIHEKASRRTDTQGSSGLELLSFDHSSKIYKTNDGTLSAHPGKSNNSITDKKSLTAYVNSRKIDANKQLREQIVDQIQERERLKSRQSLTQESAGISKPQFQKTVINRVNSNQKLLSLKQQTARGEESKTLREQMMIVSSRIQASNNSTQSKLNNTQPTKINFSRRQDYQTMLKQSFLSYISPKGADKGQLKSNQDFVTSPTNAALINQKQINEGQGKSINLQQAAQASRSGLISQQKVDKYIKTSPSRYLKNSNHPQTQQDFRYQSNKSPQSISSQFLHKTQPLSQHHQQQVPLSQQNKSQSQNQRPPQLFTSGSDSKMSFIIEVVQSDSTLFDQEYRQAGADSRIATDRGDSRQTNSQGTSKDQQPPTNIIIYRSGGGNSNL